MGSYDEWTIVYDPIVDVQPSDPDLLVLGMHAAELAASTDLQALVARSDDLAVVRMITTWPGEHYRLLHALARSIDAEIVVDIGTSTGASALAFLSVPSVREVHTYDIRDWRSYPDTLIRAADADAGLHAHIADLGRAEGFRAASRLLSSADLIFLDGPKDGSWEPSFLRLLLATEPQRDQLLVVDDIKVLTMLELWRDLPLRKCDLTSLGHWSGTGLARRS